jgi:hypothetical protein
VVLVRPSFIIDGEQFDESIYINPDDKSAVFELDKDRNEDSVLQYSYEVNIPSWTRVVDFTTEGKKLAAKEVVVEKEAAFVSKPLGLVFLHLNNIQFGSYWVIVDGVLQNSEPATQIQLNNVPSGYDDVTVVFKGTLMADLSEVLFVGNHDLNGFVINDTETRHKPHPKNFRQYTRVLDSHKNHHEKVKPKVVKVEFQTKNGLLDKADNTSVNRAVFGKEKGKCKAGMNAEKFNKLLANFESTTMEEIKVSECKQFSVDNCLTVKQIAPLIESMMFDFPDRKCAFLPTNIG